jgi:dienelactone hydrolase
MMGNADAAGGKQMNWIMLAVAAMMLIASGAEAEMVERKIGYEIDGRKFEGVLVYDDAVAGKRPAILMEPDWAGVGTKAIAQAREVAGKDYVVFVADLYGGGYAPKDTKEMQTTSFAVRSDVNLSRGRGGKALDIMLAEGDKLGIIDPAKIAGIGFCIGGGMLLDLARAGGDLKAIAVFHVTFPQSADPSGASQLRSKVLVLHGADDPVTPRKAIAALEDELDTAKVKWQTVLFSGTVHSYTDVTATDPAAAKVQRYDAEIAKRSYATMREFFAGAL